MLLVWQNTSKNQYSWFPPAPVAEPNVNAAADEADDAAEPVVNAAADEADD